VKSVSAEPQFELCHEFPFSVPETNHLNFAAGFWRLADPKISLASMTSIFLGACAAAATGAIDFGGLAMTCIGIFAFEVAKNASGEIFDFDSGADLASAPEDRSPFSGGKRVLVDGLLTRKHTILISVVAYALGILAGLAIVIWREPAVLWIGVVGVFCAFFYHAPPLKLSYRGLGEPAVAICYGPLICVGTYLVQRGKIDIAPLLASIPLGLLIANFLWIAEFPDAKADAAAGKRTLVVRFGRREASRVFTFIFVLAFVLLALLPFFKEPKTILFGAIAIVPAFTAARRLWKTPDDTPGIISAQRNTLLTFILFAIGASLGLLVG
jgi:1,4-dihydroxy-2-naphthoate octaprenyltransferase